jgi:hypothetical protein
MKRSIIFPVMFLAVGDAFAIERYTSTNLDCSEIGAILERQGAAIMRYSSERVPGMLLYNRYVANRQYCRQDQETRTVYIPSAASPKCAVKECFDPELESTKGDR